LGKVVRRHVVPNPSGGWDVVKGHGQRRSAHVPTQSEAIERARRIVTNSGGGEVVIHGRDGRIRDSDTIHPAKDPLPPRDRK
jgi:hypothetical protein